jgi:DNA-binding CsgD family transcriptional regulator
MPTIGPLVSPLMVGRDDLLTLADRRIEAVAGGRGHLLLLAGEPGVGKTRLLRAVISKAVAAGFRSAKGDLSPHDELRVLACVEDLARSMEPADFGDLGRRLLELERGRGPDSLSARRSLVRDIVDLVLEAIDRPTLLAFEDLQWSDEITLEVVAELARGAHDLPLLLIGVYRLDELPQGSIHREWRSRLLTQRLAEEARLRRLSREETGLVTTLLLGTGLPAATEIVDAVHRRTNGIPLHVEELLAAMGGDAADGRAVLGASVPDTIEDAVLAHAARLSDDARAVARAGAVLGRCFAPEVVAGILDRPAADLDEPLDELVRGGILFPFEFVDEGYYDFRHQLLRDAIYDDVPSRDLRRFHARAAEFSGALIGPSEIHTSLHYERAGMRDHAFRAALSAAREASRVYSHREAFDLYRRAVQNMSRELPDVEKAAVWMGYSDEAGALDRTEICRDAAERARELALRAGDATLAAEALANLTNMDRREGEPIVIRRDATRRFVLEAEALPDSEMGRLLRVDSLHALAYVEQDALNLAEARGYLEEARKLALDWGMDEEVQNADYRLLTIDIQEGRVADLRRVGETAARARAAGQETLAVNSYRDAAYYAARSLDYRTAGVHIADGLRFADEIQQSYCGRALASLQAMVSWADGRWDGAELEGGQALSDPGSVKTRMMANWALGWTAAGRGDRATAEQHLGQALAFAERAGALEVILPPLWGLAEAALMAGDPQTAIERCEVALTEARRQGEWGLLAPFVVTGVRAYQAAGRPDAARKWLDQVVRAIGPLAEVASPAITHGTGLVRLAEGSLGPAREALEAAMHAWDARGRRWEALWARLDLAAADLRANRYADAMQLVREVRAAADDLGSVPLLERAEHLARSAKGRGLEREAWHPLTVREYEVALKIAEGLTNAQIGEALFVSPKTVSTHVEHILAKLGASRRAEIAAWAASIASVATLS